MARFSDTRHSAWLILAALALVCIAGCGDDDDDTGDDDDTDDDDDTGDDDDVTPPGAPYVETPLSPTSLDRARIMGFADPGTTVAVEGGRDGRVTHPADAATGAFCFHLRLNPEEENELAVTASDASGNESDATVVEVEHLPDVAFYNIAKLRPADASSTDRQSPDQTPDLAVDDQLNTSWRSWRGYWNPESHAGNPQWFRVDLGGYFRFDQVRVTWADETDYGLEYALRYSSDEFNTQIPTDASWVQFWSTTAGDGEVDEIVLAEPIGASWFGIVLNRSYNVLDGNLYEIAEVEVLGAPYSLAELCE